MEDSSGEGCRDRKTSEGRTIDGMMENLKKGVSDRSEEIRQSFQKLQGKVFHAIRTINGSNYMYRYRIGLDGKLRLEQKLKGIYLTGQKLEETRKRLLDVGKDVPIQAQRRWREAVTGDPNKRIRDHMKETPQVKMIDKFSFTLGVLAIVFSEWLLLRKPNIFPSFYFGLMTLLLIWRYFDYKKAKYELFMLDFCYFVNASVMLQSLVFPDNREWFDINYVMCTGPVCMAIVVWHNSLVFHSLDKVTSYFLHVMPTMVVHGIRWKTIDTPLPIDENSVLPLKTHLLYFFTAYAAWQVMYIFLTGVVFADGLSKDPEKITSVRYLVRDTKNPLVKAILKQLRRWGVVKPDERLDPDSALAHVVFVVSQLVYTLLTSFHVRWLYQHYVASSIYIVTVFTVGVWNGASYYIEIFSKRYNFKFSDKKPVEKKAENEADGGKKAEAKAEAKAAAASTALSAASSDAGSVTSEVTNEELLEDHEDDDDHDDHDFVEALESLDLSEPQHLKLYTDLLEPYVVHSESNGESSSSSTSSKAGSEAGGGNGSEPTTKTQPTSSTEHKPEENNQSSKA